MDDLLGALIVSGIVIFLTWLLIKNDPFDE